MTPKIASKTTPSDKPAKRPTFSAPTPPKDLESDLVANDPKEEELAQNEDVVVEEIEVESEPVPEPPPQKTTSPAKSTPPKSPQTTKSELETPPPPRTITRDKLLNDSPLEHMLEEAPVPLDTPPIVAKGDTLPPKEKTDMPIDGGTKEPSSSNVLMVGFIILLIIFAGVGWGLYLNQLQPQLFTQLPSLTSPTPTPEPMPTSAPTPTPAPAIVVEILNGSGVAGAAATTQEQLEEMGFTVASIGNADSTNVETTEIYTAPGFTRSEELLNQLEDEFSTATIAGELGEGAEIDARIILGQNWFNQ